VVAFGWSKAPTIQAHTYLQVDHARVWAGQVSDAWKGKNGKAFSYWILRSLNQNPCILLQKLRFYFIFTKIEAASSPFFASMTLALKETTNSTKHHKKNKNYNKILEKSFTFNL
jgi:hypothetical protein